MKIECASKLKEKDNVECDDYIVKIKYNKSLLIILEEIFFVVSVQNVR